MMANDRQPPSSRSNDQTSERWPSLTIQFQPSIADMRASAYPIAVLLFGLAIVCAVIAGVVLFDIGRSPGDHPPANASASPGPGYSGIVGAQEAEVRSAYDARSFEERLAQASSDESRAAVIEAETRQIEVRLEELELRKDELQDLDADQSAYRAHVTSFVAQSRVLDQRLDRAQQAAETLPPALRDEYGLTAQNFRTLQNRTETLTTQKMVALARQVAGDDIGNDFENDDDDDNIDDDEEDDEDGTDEENDNDDDNNENDDDD